jgi:hypothetical protein
LSKHRTWQSHTHTTDSWRTHPRAMAIDGLIILDSTNVKPIVQTSFRSFPPTYPLLHIDAYSAALEKVARPEDIDPVLLVNLPDSPTACCHLQHRSLTFLCPISGDGEFVRCLQLRVHARSFSFSRHPSRNYKSTPYMPLRSSALF